VISGWSWLIQGGTIESTDYANDRLTGTRTFRPFRRRVQRGGKGVPTWGPDNKGSPEVNIVGGRSS